MDLSRAKPTTTAPDTVSGSNSARDLLLGCLIGLVISMGWNLALKTDLRIQRQVLEERDLRINLLERTVSANAVEWRGLMSEPIGLYMDSRTGDVMITVPYSKAPVKFAGVCRPETIL